MPTVAPMPPRAGGPLPWVGAGLGLLRDPTAYFGRTRERLGDTFLVDAFGYRLFCVFSAEGVRSLYSLPEREASKGVADYALLRHKVPDELFAGRRHRPHDLFGSQEVEGYLANVEEAVRLQQEELGSQGRFEIFEYTRRLGHRVGLASWAGVEAASPGTLDRLIPLFDQLDSSESFVHPASAFLSHATKKRREITAMQGIDEILGEIVAERDRLGSTSGDFLDQIRAGWQDAEGPERARGVSRDLVLIHMGSQSNLFAAMAWTLIQLLAHPQLLARVREGDDDLLERCANEATRVAQRSITLRQVLRPCEVEDEQRSYRLEPGVFVTTMLSVLNTTSAPGLDRFDPDHYQGRRLVGVDLPARELVSTFGHGKHACPAQRFAITSIRISLRRLFDAYDLEALYREAKPLRRQIGGVSRAAAPCRVRYRRRSA